MTAHQDEYAATVQQDKHITPYQSMPVYKRARNGLIPSDQKRTPPRRVRTALVRRVRREISLGIYEDSEKIDLAISRLIIELQKS